MLIPISTGTLLDDLDRLGLARELFDKRLRLGTVAKTFDIVLCLLEAFNFKDSDCSGVVGEHPVSRESLGWVFNGYQRLGRVICIWLHHARLDEVDIMGEVSVKLLGRIQSYCASGSYLSTGVMLTPDLLQIVNDFLALDNLGQFTGLQVELSRFIESVTSCSNAPDTYPTCARNHLLPTLQTIKNASNDHLELSLQVGFLGKISALPSCLLTHKIQDAVQNFLNRFEHAACPSGATNTMNAGSLNNTFSGSSTAPCHTIEEHRHLQTPQKTSFLFPNAESKDQDVAQGLVSGLLQLLGYENIERLEDLTANLS